jgi:Uncharacterised nucleotidyltransferase
MPTSAAKPFSESSPLHRLEPAAQDLLRALSYPPESIASRQIEELTQHVKDWDRFLAVGWEHRVLPLVFSRLTAVGATIPAAAHERLKSAYDRNVFHCMSNASELIAILKEFELERIPAMPFKGIVLGATIYHEVSERNAGDIDILVNAEDLTRATAILLKRGFDLKTQLHGDGSPALPDSYEYHFERPTDGMVVELRWRLELTQPRYRRNIGLQWVWRQRQSAKLAGIQIPNMDPETTLLVLCMHGSKHVWSRFIWICDVAHLLATFPAINWKQVTHEARHLGLWRALALGVLLAHRVCRADVPPRILRRFEADTTALGLACTLDGNLFERPGELPGGHLPYNVKLLGFRDRVGIILSPGFFRPNQRDLNFITLPRVLSPFYFLVRPPRLLRDKSSR